MRQILVFLFISSLALLPCICFAASCIDFDRCDDCIASFDHCVWCVNSTNDQYDGICMDYATGVAVCDIRMLDPPGYYEIVDDSHPTISPTEVLAYIRPGIQLDVPVVVENIMLPIDLVLVEDLSGSMPADLAYLRDNAADLFNSITTLVPGSLLGMTSFVDKCNYPTGHTQHCDESVSDSYLNGYDCWTYPFMIMNKLIDDAVAFSAPLIGFSCRNNHETEENIPDGMLHSIICDYMEWRNNSRKFVMMSTDRSPRLSPQEVTMNLLRPSKEECGTLYGHFSLGAQMGPPDAEAYPTMGQIRTALRDGGVTPVFAARQDNSGWAVPVEQVYPSMVKAFGDLGGFSYLQSSSANLLTIINDSYYETSAVLQMFVQSWKYNNFAVISPRQFTGVEFDVTRTFTIQLLWEYSEQLQTVLTAAGGGNITEWEDDMTFSVFGLGSVRIRIRPYLQCNCTGIRCPGDCSGNGECDCGRCNCDPGYDRELDPSCNCAGGACIPFANCSGHGECICGECKCSSPWTLSGGTCNCSSNCYVEGAIPPKPLDCGAADGRGECKCGACECNYPFNGTNCECRVDDICNATNCVYGSCVCGECECDPRYKDDENAIVGPYPIYCNCSKKACPPACAPPYGKCHCGECQCEPGYILGPDDDCNCQENNICLNDCSNTTAPIGDRGECACGKCFCNDAYKWPIEEQRTDGTVIQYSYKYYMDTWKFLHEVYSYENVEYPEQDCSCEMKTLGEWDEDFCSTTGGVDFCSHCYCAPGYGHGMGSPTCKNTYDNCACHNETDTCEAKFGGCDHGDCVVCPCDDILECSPGECWVHCICHAGWTKKNGSEVCDELIDKEIDECVGIDDCSSCVYAGSSCGLCPTDNSGSWTVTEWEAFENMTNLSPSVFYANVTETCYKNGTVGNLCPWTMWHSDDYCPRSTQTGQDAVEWALTAGIITLALAMLFVILLASVLVCFLLLLTRIGGAVVSEKITIEEDVVESVNPLFEEKNETHFNPLFDGVGDEGGEDGMEMEDMDFGDDDGGASDVGDSASES